MLEHLNLPNQPDALRCDWVDAKVALTSLIVNVEVDIYAVGIVVGDLSKWLILPISREKRICISLHDNMCNTHVDLIKYL